MLSVLLITARADIGGGPEHVYKLAKHLSKVNSIYIACPDDEPYSERYQELLGTENVWLIPHRRISLSSLLKLRRKIRAQGISLLHSHGKGASVYGRALRLLTACPLVHTAHGIHVDEYSVFMKVIYCSYEYLSGFLMNYVIFVSSSEQMSALHYRFWTHIPSSIVANGVDAVSDKKRQNWRLELRRSLNLEDAFTILTANRFETVKNMIEAYQIAKRLPECVFLWLADGPEKEHIEQLSIQENVTNIRFVGAVPSIMPYLAMADLYLTCSKREGLPLTLLEAMSVGLSIVASNVQGNKDIVIQGETGYLYSLGDLAEAVESLNLLINDADLRMQFGTRAFELQQKYFSASAMSKAILNIYRELV